MTSPQVKSSNNYNKLVKRLRRNVGQAIEDYRMISEGDRVMVCMSGGKDSFTMLDMLLKLKASAPVNFELLAVNLDQKQPNFPAEVLPRYFESLGVDYQIINQDTYSVVKRVIPVGKTMCGLCSRLRRGALYTFAKANGITKIALGHHRDDIIETLFLNMFHGGRLSAMPPKLLSEDGRNVVIRPLAYCRESDIEKYSTAQAFPIIPCQLCGSQDHLQRVAVKSMLSEWERAAPGRLETIFRAIRNVQPSHLADPSAFDFRALGETGDAASSAIVDWLRPQTKRLAYNSESDQRKEAASR